MTRTAKRATSPIANEISFDCTDEEKDLIHRIAGRAAELGLINRKYSKLTCIMDINAAHSNGNPLRLRELLAADGFNFTHDVCGIARHLNRDTGKLENFFSPRFSKH